MERIVYTETLHNSGLRILYRKWREPHFGTSYPDGEYEYQGSTQHKALIVQTQSGRDLHCLELFTLVGRTQDGYTRMRTHYGTRLQEAITWLHRCLYLAQHPTPPQCHNLGNDQPNRNHSICPYLAIEPDQETLGCMIQPLPYGYTGSSHGIRPLPDHKLCDLRWTALNYTLGNRDSHAFSLEEYWRCATGEMLQWIQEPPKPKPATLCTCGHPYREHQPWGQCCAIDCLCEDFVEKR